MKNTIFTQFLTALKVKHTAAFSDKLYRIHPYRDSLYGLSHMLKTYGVYNEGVRSVDKNVRQFVPPFIAHVGEEFVVVKAISENNVTYDWRSIEIKNSFDNFKEVWSGVALLAEPAVDSVEPDYKKHLMITLAKKLQTVLLCIIPSLFLLGAWYANMEQIGVYGTMLSLINLAGIFISYLLLLKQEKRQSDYADKICSLFHQRDCNNILEMPAAKVGIFSWNEIGLGYFIANLLLIILFPKYIFYQAIINIFALPYTVWSVWYQYKKVRQWCMLCLIVQVLLWAIFLTNILGVCFNESSLSIIPSISIGSFYVFIVLLINISTMKIAHSNRLELLEQGFTALKNSDNVFKALLKSQPYFETQDTTKIVFGNSKAKLKVTILTNPHCEPCGQMHTRVKKMLAINADKLCVQYIFSAFSDDLLDSNRFLIATYLNGKSGEIDEIYKDWYEKGKYHSDDFIAKYNFSFEGVEEELEKHEQWKRYTHLVATPKILVNGYLLPPQYTIENLSFFLDTDI